MKFWWTPEVVIKKKKNYLRVWEYGVDNYKHSLRLWKKIAAAAEKYDCYSVLGESFTTELSVADAYDMVKIFGEAHIDHRFRIAWVHRGKEFDKMSEFVETVILNRALVSGHLFKTLKEAKYWLAHDELLPKSRS